MNVHAAAQSANLIQRHDFAPPPARPAAPGHHLPVFADTLPRSSVLQMFELLPQALLVLTEFRTLIASNQRALRLMADRHIQLVDGRVTQLAQLDMPQIDQMLRGVCMTGSFDCGIWLEKDLTTGWLRASAASGIDIDDGCRAMLVVIQLDQPGLTQAARIDAVTRQCGLSPAERHVLMLLADGMTVDAAAQHLKLKMSTLRSHVRNLLGKTQAPTLMQLLRWTGSAAARPQ